MSAATLAVLVEEDDGVPLGVIGAAASAASAASAAGKQAAGGPVSGDQAAGDQAAGDQAAGDQASGGRAGQTQAEQPGPDAKGDEEVKGETDGDELVYVVKYVTDSSRFGRNARNNPLTVTIRATKATLPATVARELLGVYTMDGWGGVANFGSGVFGLDEYTEFVRRGGLRRGSGIGPAEGDERVDAMRDEVTEDRRPLWDAFEVARRELLVRVRHATRQIQEAAVQVARQRVAECRDLVLAEAVRYLSLAEPRDVSARAVLNGGRQDALAQGRAGGLSGPDGPALMAQLTALLPAKRKLEELRTVLLANEGIDAAARYAPLVIPSLMPFAPLIQQNAPPLDPGTAATLQQVLAVASHALTEVFAGAAAGFPILSKLIGEDTAEPRAVAVAVTEILQDAWAACDELDDELAAASEKVWRLPQLVELTVARRFGRDAEFAERVAADALAAHGRELSPVEVVSAVVQGVDSALMLVPAPPVQLAMVLISLITGVAEVIDSYLRDRVRRRAARAALDPSLALDTAPSFLGLIVHAALLALCVLPVPGLAAEARAARRGPRLPI